jgi:hypothetical protein
MPLHKHVYGQPAHNQPCARIDGQGGERGAAIVPVPDENFRRAAIEESRHRGIDLTGEKLAHFRVFGLGLLLAADATHALSIGDYKHALRLRRGRRDGEEHDQAGFHSSAILTAW